MLVGSNPRYIAITPDNTEVFVSNMSSNNVDVINVATDTVTAVIPVGNDPFVIVFTPLSSTSSVNVQCKKNIFLTQTEFYNVITWTALTTGFVPVQYAIYRDASFTDLVGVVPANGPLIFEDHNRKKKQIYTYYVVAVNMFGINLLLGSTLVQCNCK